AVRPGAPCVSFGAAAAIDCPLHCEGEFKAPSRPVQTQVSGAAAPAPGFPTLLCGCRTLLARLACAALAAAFARAFVRVFFPAPGTGLVAAARFLVHRRPGATLGFLLGNAAVFVSFGDMLGLTLLLVGVAA